ncbi:MAG: type II toxin-antitoxin system RelE/ParE family toxin [Oscillospiraceae bacterium]|nr:type II toxin-antitoxin system RelE/ParE family toxin [Oscillospiraceae bacterium]
MGDTMRDKPTKDKKRGIYLIFVFAAFLVCTVIVGVGVMYFKSNMNKTYVSIAYTPEMFYEVGEAVFIGTAEMQDNYVISERNGVSAFVKRIVVNEIGEVTAVIPVHGSADSRAVGRALSENLTGYWRYRVGDYRVICEIRDDVLEIAAVKVGHRGGIYRR